MMDNIRASMPLHTRAGGSSLFLSRLVVLDLDMAMIDRAMTSSGEEDLWQYLWGR